MPVRTVTILVAATHDALEDLIHDYLLLRVEQGILFLQYVSIGWLHALQHVMFHPLNFICWFVAAHLHIGKVLMLSYKSAAVPI